MTSDSKSFVLLILVVLDGVSLPCVGWIVLAGGRFLLPLLS